MDGQGDEVLVEEGRQLSSNKHSAVVSAIYSRARQIANGRLQANAHGNGDIILWEEAGQMELDNTIVDAVANPLGAQEASVAEQAGLRNMGRDMLEIHGTYPGTKPEGIYRILYENATGIDCRTLHHPKVAKARRIHNMLEADIVAYNEHRLNLRHKDNKIGFNQLFYGGESDI